MGYAATHPLRSGFLKGTPLLLALLAAACGEKSTSQKISIDGSSTVFPITEAVVEEYARQHPAARITVGISGTGGGFQKFCRREIDLTNASRPITDREGQDCQRQDIDYLPLTVAFDGLVVVVHPSNTWVKSLKVSELKKMWEPAAQHRILRWNQIRPEWPAAEIHLFGAGTASGTYDYFTQAIVGQRHASRGDYTASEDDNVLVQGVSTDPLALGFFGFAYYEANHAALRLVPIDDEQPGNGTGPVTPTVETVKNNTYAPLSRPLLLYVSSVAARRPEVQTFLHFYLVQAPHLAREVGYIPLPATEYRRQQTRFDEFVAQQR
ncbi:PstS family phosphate ABC transporter substrate-binding protein [Hymenobacter sp. BT188]|uniref:PstS family phosphate ABC transporter substrate-binding protein n=1 Tax=Hymenobacter sp. BT188 TaxID=2763504 RepID=UPI0016510C58|nr:PstS family phosphate ABC transporter substrate-binding protein [Hymenobacter sp. BT188]MBC6605797.1 PstS family phosphate ABC transporter substrate-binding protein [Hymenobacter sp. BT188]